MPGDNVEMTIELIHPVAMEQGLTFAIREGGRTVGSGRVVPSSSNSNIGNKILNIVLKRKMPVELRFYGFFCSTVHLKHSIAMNRIFAALQLFLLIKWRVNFQHRILTCLFAGWYNSLHMD
mgnify:CR=1 FL=1